MEPKFFEGSLKEKYIFFKGCCYVTSLEKRRLCSLEHESTLQRLELLGRRGKMLSLIPENGLH